METRNNFKTLYSTAKLLSSLHSPQIKTTDNLRGLSTPSPNIAWASGFNGTYLKTINQGSDWECSQIPSVETLQFRDIKAFDENTAYIMSAGNGIKSRIYKTIDGGQHWQLQLTGSEPAEFFNGMAFWNRDHGMVLSDPVQGKFKLYITENGGKTWFANDATGMPNALENEGAFAASGSCMTTLGTLDAWFGTGGNTARVFHTQDGGKNWQVKETPIMHSSKTSGIFSISFYDLNHGVIVGGDYNEPKKGGNNLAITQDGGYSWELAAISPQFYWSSVAYANDGENIIVAGNKHVGVTSSKLPEKWEESWEIDGLNAISFWGKGKAVAVGDKDQVVEFAVTAGPK